MKVFIIGSQGFIGRHLVKYFTGKSWQVSGCDLLEDSPAYSYYKVSVLSPDFDTLFSNNEFNVCINASGSGNVSYSITQPVSDFEANTILVSRILDSIRKHQPECKFLQISSAAVYGNPEHLPVKETDSIAPLSPYGYHKWMSELLCREYQKLYNLNIAIIRPFSVYGTGLKKQLIWELCNKLKNQEKVKLFGTGKESRDFIHIDDLVQSISLIADKSAFNGDVYNVASGTETTIESVAEIFKQSVGNETRIAFSGKFRKGDPNNWKADISKMKSLGFKTTISLKQGLGEYTKWFNTLHE